MFRKAIKMAPKKSPSPPKKKTTKKNKAKKSAPNPNVANSPTIDPAEVAKFQAFADTWWDTDGKMAPLHKFNPARLGYIRHRVIDHFGKDTDTLKPLENLSVLDVGCGGGVLSEPLARMGGKVTGIDVTEDVVKVAKLHAQESGLDITYQHTSAETLVEAGKKYDVVICLEVIEHVPDPQALVDTLSQLVKPDGILFISTINRTYKSYALAIVGAEYVLRWLPKGTHQWEKFLRPSEIAHMTQKNAMTVNNITGLCLNILKWQWQENPRDLEVNYILTAVHQK